jgi:hypothetical protein
MSGESLETVAIDCVVHCNMKDCAVIGPAEIEDMMAEYSAALEAGDPIARVTRPVWATDPGAALRNGFEEEVLSVGALFGPPFGPGLASLGSTQDCWCRRTTDRPGPEASSPQHA